MVSKFWPVPGREPKVPPSDQRGRNGPLFKGRPDGPARVAIRPLGVDRDRDHSRRARTDVPCTGKAAWDASRSNRPVAVPIARSARGPEGCLYDPRDLAASRHDRVPFGTERSQSLVKRSFQARSVRGTCSENPVNRWSTAPFDHSRKT